MPTLQMILVRAQKTGERKEAKSTVQTENFQIDLRGHSKTTFAGSSSNVNYSNKAYVKASTRGW